MARIGVKCSVNGDVEMKRRMTLIALAAAVLLSGAVLHAGEITRKPATRVSTGKQVPSNPFALSRSLNSRKAPVNPFVAYSLRRVRRVLLVQTGTLVAAAVLSGYLLRRRNVLLRKPAEDPADTWFQFHVASNKVYLVAVVVVLIPSLVADPEPALRLLIGFRWPLLLSALPIVVIMTPYLLLTGLVSAVSRQVFTQLRGAKISRMELFLQGLLPLMWAVPLLLLYLAVTAFFDGMPVRAALFAGFAPACWLLLLFLGWRTFRVRCERLPQCPLSERIFSLAEEAGVKLTDLQILTPRIPVFSGNPFSIHGSNMLLTDGLIEQLTTREVDAVVAHELAHARRKHPQRKVWAGVVGALLGFGVLAAVTKLEIVPAVPVAENLQRVLCFFLCLGVWALALSAVSRRHQKIADADAIKLTGDPEAFITAMARVYKLFLWPVQWKKRYELVMSQPSLMRRLKPVAERAGITREMLQSLVDSAHTGDSYYAIPVSVPGSETVFSSHFRRKVVVMNGFAILLMIAIPPTLVALAVSRFELEGLARATAYGAGLLLTWAGLVWCAGFMMMAGSRKLKSGLQAKLARQGIDLRGWDATFVGFFPDDSGRAYEGFSDRDIGFLMAAGNRLCFLGDSMKFALERESLVSAELGPATRVACWSLQRVVINWRKADGGSGSFCVSCHDLRNASSITPANKHLVDTINAWLNGLEAVNAAPAMFGDLGLPEEAPANGSSPRASCGTVLVSGLLCAGLAFILCIGLRLFPNKDAGPALYAMSAPFLVCVLWEALGVASRQAPMSRRPPSAL